MTSPTQVEQALPGHLRDKINTKSESRETVRVFNNGASTHEFREIIPANLEKRGYDIIEKGDNFIIVEYQER